MGKETTQTTPTGGGSGGTGLAGQAQSIGWRAGLPTELQEHDWLKGFSKVGDFATAALALKERSEKAVVRPADGASESEWQAFYKALGVPEREEGYDLKAPTPPEGSDIAATPEFLVDFKKLAAKAKLTKEQAASVFGELYGRVYAAMQAQKKAEADEDAKEKAGREKIKKEIGEEALKQAGELIVAFNDPELVNELDATTLGDNPRLIKFIAWARSLVSPDKLVKASATTTSSQTKEEPGKPTRLQFPWMREFYGKQPE